MPSSIAWLDTTREQQQAARELIAMFSEPEGREELGIGQIRDSLSDLLFPGTSTLHTRARYFLFVPWCYTHAKAMNTSGDRNRSVGEYQERELVRALQTAEPGSGAGVIGGRVGPAVKNLPSVLYWSALLHYGIRTHRGGFGSLGAPSGLTGLIDGDTELSGRNPSEWDPYLPQAPSDFPGFVETGFDLTHDEALWLRDRMLAAAPDTVLSELLLRDHEIPETDFVWQLIPSNTFEGLDHARRFSEAIHGAQLLYNLLVAERYESKGFTTVEEPVSRYQAMLANWQLEVLNRTEIRHWSLPDLWSQLWQVNPNLHPRATSFVESWMTGVINSDDPANDRHLRSLVWNQESRKGAQSRLQNDKKLAAWSGAAGVGRLSYRWGNVTRIVNDILKGLSDART